MIPSVVNARDIESAFLTLHNIGNTSSRTEKDILLKNGMNNPIFKFLVYYTYNPFLMFNIKKDPKVEPMGKEIGTHRLVKFKDLLDDLQARTITGNDAIKAVSDLFSECTSEEYKWYLKVLQKDMKIGITEKSINKIEKKFIPVFDCALAQPFKRYPKKFIIDTKLDGYRCLAFHYSDGTVVLRTRNGHQIVGYTGIEHEIAERTKSGMVYDGEIIAREGSFNATQKDIFKLGKKDKDGVHNIFDCLPIEEFRLGKSLDSLSKRLVTLYLSVNFDDAYYLKRVLPSDIYTEEDEEEVMSIYNSFVDQGYEGAMIKDLSAVYECKRSYAIQKLKPMETLDLEIVDVQEGEPGTKYEGKLGAVVVAFEGYEVNVGSGFSDAQRDELWVNKNDLINRIIEVKFQEVTTNKNNTKSLRFPTFVKFRYDK